MSDPVAPPVEEVADRLRAALAEVGYEGPEAVMIRDGGCYFRRDAVPVDVAWRAREISLLYRPRCFACFERELAALARREVSSTDRSPCEAAGPLTPDCGWRP